MKKWAHMGHEFDVIGKELKKCSTIVIYGNPYYSSEILEVLENYRCKKKLEIYIVDSSEELQKNGFGKFKVHSPNELWEKPFKEYIYIVSAERASQEIRNILLKKGVSESIIFSYLEFKNTYLSVLYWYREKKVFFLTQNIVPNTLCNLKCKNCLNFNPYIDKPIVDSLEHVLYDIDLFFKNVDMVYRFNVCGGEPFLNKDLGKILGYICEKYIDRIFILETVTNGMVVPDDELCTILNRYKILVTLDDYRHAVKDGENRWNKVVEKLEKYDIYYIVNNYMKEWICLYSPGTFPHMNDSETQLMQFYERCSCPFSSLRNGKISGCTYAHFAIKANVDGYDEDCYFPLEGEVDKKELLEFRLGFNKKGYLEFCKKCNGYYISDKYVPVAEQVR